MGAIPAGLDTDNQPPMTVPLRHFLVAFGFLVLGTLVGIGVRLVPGFGALAHIHLLLAGWICITIMGAMTQFVPVWCGTAVHSRRLANAQLVLVVVGLLGFAVALVLGLPVLFAPFGIVLLAGFWTFAYNIGRTLLGLETYDVTERHFAMALFFFLLLTSMGLILAADLAHPMLGSVPVGHSQVLGAHATLAVFGAILTTVYGALYQLATMFTQTDLHGIDRPLQRLEERCHPVGVVLLAGGRLTGWPLGSRVGGLMILVAALSVSIVLARKLLEMNVERTPMHTRYAVVPPALFGWVAVTLPAWLAAPTAPQHRFGGPGTAHLLLLGGVGFVVFGTIYHIVPFIIWVHRYSDLLGFEDVPMIDDLYDDRLASLDFGLLLSGTAAIVGADLLRLPALLQAIGGILLGLGVVVFTANIGFVVRTHSSRTVEQILLGTRALGTDTADTDSESETPAPDR